MIDALVFSKDRAAQLDALLRSVDVHAHHLYRSVTVLWTASDRCYVDGYRRCRELHTADARWWQQGDFETDVFTWLESVGEIVSFLVDDDVFFRDAERPLEVPWSYRGGDFDYPFSVDGNVYAKEDVERLLHRLHFDDPTQMEALAHEHRKRLPFAKVAHGTACLVGVPLNRVSKSSGMPHMGVHEYDLNERFLAGDRMTYFGEKPLAPELQDVMQLAAHERLHPVWSNPVHA